MDSKLNNTVKGSSTTSGWLAGLMLRRGGELLPRFVLYYRELARRPRAWRRKLRRQLPVTLSGAALLLALAGPVRPATANPDATPAVIEVVDGEVADVDNGQCSLIEALINARATWAGSLRDDCAAGNLVGADTIVLPTGGYFELTEIHNEVYGPTGLPLIRNDVTIEGNGATIHRSDAPDTPKFRILAVNTAGGLTMNDTTISNGHTTDNHSGGGGIFSNGSLDLSGSTITSNSADGYWASGGGVFAGGQTNITNCSITTNKASGNEYASGGGLFIGGQAVISGSSINANEVSGQYESYGGGIAVLGQATITNSLIAENIARGSIDGSFGGGINVIGEATIAISTIKGNIVYAGTYDFSLIPGYGGGLSNRGDTLVVNSTISENEASGGGGLSNVGEWSENSHLTVIHSTVSGNRAVEFEGDYYNTGGLGGGVFSGDSLRFENCGATTLQGVIVAGNTADASGDQIELEPPSTETCTPTITVDAFNVFGQDGEAGLHGLSPGATDVVPSVGLSAILGPLADNGGPTLTHALPPGSPALDIVPSASCAAEPVNGIDQRGEPRNRNGTGGLTANECDAGSFELFVEPTIYLPVITSPATGEQIKRQ